VRQTIWVRVQILIAYKVAKIRRLQRAQT